MSWAILRPISDFSLQLIDDQDEFDHGNLYDSASPEKILNGSIDKIPVELFRSKLLIFSGRETEVSPGSET